MDLLSLPVSLGDHVARWENCSRCNLCQERHKVVLFRYHGHIKISPSRRPYCDILMIGEAPGEVEDLRGQPFIGPAGKLLSDCIRIGIEQLNRKYPDSKPCVGITNIVSCWPWDTDINETVAPTKYQAEACSERLIELITSANPRWIVCLGRTAKDLFPGGFAKAHRTFPGIKGISHIVHPASILHRSSSTANLSAAKTEFIASILEVLCDWKNS